MARHPDGPTIRLAEGRRVYTVRFQYHGRTIERSTGETDRGRATKRGHEIFSEVVLGIVAPQVINSDLVIVMGEWLADYEATHAEGTAENATDYAKLFISHFGGLDRFTATAYNEFTRARIAKVSRTTLRKELSALRMFIGWLAAERGIKLPGIPALPKIGHEGTRAKNARRRKATILSVEEVDAILSALPVRGPRSGSWVRPFVTVCWETSLRPYSTVARLETPLHFERGSKTLFVSREIDKAKYERTVPITKAAREALDFVLPKAGKIFPDVNKDSIRESLAAALRRAGINKPFSIYDVRHSRISHWANSGRPLAGVAFLAGHKHVSTTALYVRSSEKAAEAVLDD